MRWPGKPRKTRKITLYGKPGCHLCEDARVLLEHVSQHHPLQIEEVDITRDAALFRAYDIRIPVILIDDTIEIEAPITTRSLTEALRRSPPR